MNALQQLQQEKPQPGRGRFLGHGTYQMLQPIHCQNKGQRHYHCQKGTY